MTITAIVLCGGRSTRMGRDKASLPFGDETMLERVARLVGEVAEAVIVVGRRSQTLEPSSLQAFKPSGPHAPEPANPQALKPRSPQASRPSTIVHDAIADQGPLAGIAAGLAATTTDLNIIVACDMPLLRPAVLRRLIERIGEADLAVADVDGHSSVLCGVYRSRVAPIAQALLDSGERRVMALLERVQTKRVDAASFRDIDPDLDTFVSVDTPEKYQRALDKI